MRAPLSFDRFGLSHWWSIDKECLFDFFFYFRWLVVVIVLGGWGQGEDFIAYTAPMKLNLCKAPVV